MLVSDGSVLNVQLEVQIRLYTYNITGVNKPFKNRIKKFYDSYIQQIFDEYGHDSSLFNANIKKPIPRKTLAEWVIQAWNDIPEEVVRNAWRSKNLSWI